LPGFRLALNYRLVFLAAFGFAGLAALGADQVQAAPERTRLWAFSFATALALGCAFVASEGVFRDRQLSGDFVEASFLAECVPLLLLAAAGFLRGLSGRSLATFT